MYNSRGSRNGEIQKFHRSRNPARQVVASKNSSYKNSEIELVTNAYSLALEKPNILIYEYRLGISLSQGFDNQPEQVLKRGYVERSIKRLIMTHLASNIFTSQQILEENVIIESNMNFIYSLRPLSSDSTHEQEGSQQISLIAVPVETELIKQLTVDIVIAYSRRVPVQSSIEKIILESSLHHRMSITMTKYGNTYYLPPCDMPLINLPRNRLDLISLNCFGISLSGLRKNFEHKTLVVVGTSYSNLTGPFNLFDLLLSYMSGRAVDTLSPELRRDVETRYSRALSSIRGNEDWLKEFCNILAGFKCRTDSFGYSVNFRFNLTRQSTLDLTVFDENSSQEISLYDLYARSNIILKYPNLPCIETNIANCPYYSLEHCFLVHGQKVPIFRLNESAQQQLMQHNKPRPQDFRESSRISRDRIESVNSKHLKSLGIKIDQEPISAKGLVMSKPTLQFKNQPLEPFADFWESKTFVESIHLNENWCVVNTTQIDLAEEDVFFRGLSNHMRSFGFQMSCPQVINRSKQNLLEDSNGLGTLITECSRLTRERLRLVIFVIDSNSTQLVRQIHLSIDDHPTISAACLRAESVTNRRQHRSIFRTFGQKLNARLGGTNVTYTDHTFAKLNLSRSDLMVVGLDVTHPDNELSGVSIVGCAYTYSRDLFRHKSLVWPQTARKEIIGKLDKLMKHILADFLKQNGRLPRHIIVYRDGVSHEEFDRVKNVEVTAVESTLRALAKESRNLMPNLSYIIAQKRHSMRFFQLSRDSVAFNPPVGTIIDKDVVQTGREFYLYSSSSPQVTARPLHYHVLVGGLELAILKELTFILCFNCGRCSRTLSMPSSLRYAHNAAYDARNRVIAAREFSENKFYSTKYFC